MTYDKNFVSHLYLVGKWYPGAGPRRQAECVSSAGEAEKMCKHHSSATAEAEGTTKCA